MLTTGVAFAAGCGDGATIDWGGSIGDGDSCGAVIDESVTEIITDGDATAVVSGGEVGAIASTDCD